jgi:DNA primase
MEPWRPSRVLYRLPEVIQADTVWLCEGEKDADNLTALGLCGTTLPNGAEKAGNLQKRFDILKPLRGKTIILIGDNDETGQEHIRQIARLLQGIAASVKIIELPDLPEKGDISDFIEIHGKERAKESLLELIASTPECEPSAEQIQNNTLVDLTPPPTTLEEARELLRNFVTPPERTDKLDPIVIFEDRFFDAYEVLGQGNSETDRLLVQTTRHKISELEKIREFEREFKK